MWNPIESVESGIFALVTSSFLLLLVRHLLLVAMHLLLVASCSYQPETLLAKVTEVVTDSEQAFSAC